MKILRALAFLVLSCWISSCAEGFRPEPLLSKVLILPISDFGPADLSTALFGPMSPSATVVIHYSLPEKYLASKYPGFGHAPVVTAIKHLNRVITTLPRDASHTELRARLMNTRSRLLDYYNTRRVAFNSVPPFVGRGFMARQALMPNLGNP